VLGGAKVGDAGRSGLDPDQDPAGGETRDG
jgi:hypothetical protein